MKNKKNICDMKIKEIDALCFSEDRKPIKLAKDIVDLTFRDTISPEKYINSRKKYRNFRDTPYSYKEIENFLLENNLSKEVTTAKATVMSGYALSDDGYWHFHSWLINVKNNSMLLETTPCKKLVYFEYALNLKECEEFYSWY